MNQPQSEPDPQEFEDWEDLFDSLVLSKRKPNEIRAILNAHESFVETIRWVAQSVHQAHHELGRWQECHMVTCKAAQHVLAGIGSEIPL